MNLEDEYRSVRHGAALSRMDHVGLVRVSGEDATEAVDAICSGDLWVRDGRMIQTLILGEQGQPVADVYVCPDDDACILMFEGTLLFLVKLTILSISCDGECWS